ncbi:MAG: sulfatase-like hydrolase/transferase [Deltaproteobacteria bacterium]|nr:sulfatase-like hydrolase/transferase [Deltaproteobacteria bacterium]
MRAVLEATATRAIAARAVPSRDTGRLGRLDLFVASGLAVAVVDAGLDVALRRGLAPAQLGRHALLCLALDVVVGTLLAAAAAAVVTLCEGLARLLPGRSARARDWLGSALYGLLGGALCFWPVRWTIGASTKRDTALVSWGPFAASLCVGLTLVAASLALRHAGRTTGAVRWRRGFVVALLLGVAGGACTYVDLTFFVALYARLHELLHAFGALALLGAVALLLRLLQHGRPRLRVGASIATALAGAWSFVFVIAADARAWLGEELAYAWRQPVRVDRLLGRVQLAEAFLADPTGWRSAAATQLDRLRRRYDVASTALAGKWLQPAGVPAPLRDELARARAGAANYNVVVYYVDTLRYDVGTDPVTMPNAVRFAARSLSFGRAYATASDTVSTLPSLLAGSYLPEEAGEDLLARARRGGMSSAVATAQSCAEFLAKHVPSFRFDQTLSVPDYEPGKKVWGYGADRATAGPVVDAALGWLEHNAQRRFLLWVLQYDVHSWHELDQAYLEASAQRLGVPGHAPLEWRYRVAAAAVDQGFGRLLAGLDRLGLADRTVVVLVSDHGEALGRDGFWMHSTFLWESLLHVPLSIRIPRLAPRRIDAVVGHVDLLPTLAPYLAPGPDGGRRHGLDLLAHVVAPRSRWPLPLLALASRGPDLARVGLIDRDRDQPFKLVLPLESAVPELYDLQADQPDDAEVGERNPGSMLQLLDELLRSPVFPRAAADQGVPRAATEGGPRGTARDHG